MEVPRVTKVTLNMGVGDAKTDAKAMDAAIDELTTIAGQHAQVRRATKSIASFKLREGMPVGARVTLRGTRMYEFLDRLASIALPRIRDFRGLDPGSFDGRGNYSIGIREQIIFPEIDYDKVPSVRGLDIAITTSATTDEHGRALLGALGLPFAAEGTLGSVSVAKRSAPRRPISSIPRGREAGQVEGAQGPRSRVVKHYTRYAQPVRSTEGGLSQVRALPDLPARARPPGRRSRHDEVELVGEEMLTDPIADMLTRIRNANRALHDSASMPTSRMKEEIARILKDEGYIADYRVVETKDEKDEPLPYKTLVVELKFARDRRRVITDLKRVSKPGRRVYAGKDRLPRVLGGLGTAIMSTSTGVITHRQAAERGVGGEVIAFVW